MRSYTERMIRKFIRQTKQQAPRVRRDKGEQAFRQLLREVRFFEVLAQEASLLP